MAWKGIVEIPEPAPKRIFTPTKELTIAEWERYGSSRNRDRA
jgi:hypothetical protein